ncbi:hypothetical protein JHK86_001049 [Glycine max]|nr:hypothetical protein JHK86_001049 [Glycine max]
MVGFSFNEVGCLHSRKSKVLSSHFSSDGKVLVSAGHEKKVIRCNKFSNSSFVYPFRIIATSSFDRSVRLWDAARLTYFATMLPDEIDLLAMVNDFVLSQSGWDMCKLESMLPPHIYRAIMIIVALVIHNQDDVSAWHHTNDAQFFIASAYNAVARVSDIKDWKGLERMRLHTWKVARQTLVTNVMRHARGLVENDMCPNCHGAFESSIHVFRDCTLPRKSGKIELIKYFIVKGGIYSWNHVFWETNQPYRITTLSRRSMLDKSELTNENPMKNSQRDPPTLKDGNPQVWRVSKTKSKSLAPTKCEKITIGKTP